MPLAVAGGLYKNPWKKGFSCLEPGIIVICSCFQQYHKNKEMCRYLLLTMHGNEKYFLRLNTKQKHNL